MFEKMNCGSVACGDKARCRLTGVGSDPPLRLLTVTNTFATRAVGEGGGKSPAVCAGPWFVADTCRLHLGCSQVSRCVSA